MPFLRQRLRQVGFEKPCEESACGLCKASSHKLRVEIQIDSTPDCRDGSPLQEIVAATAPANLSTTSEIWLSVVMKGGAKSTWSPFFPSLVPAMG